jgi:MFS family permease
MTLAYQFKPHERPVVPGSPFNPDHPPGRMVAYGLMGVLAALTGGLGNALVTTNLPYFQGTLGLTAEEVALSPAIYATTYICANLVLVKFRQQFGLLLFLRVVLVAYVLATAMHLFVHGFWSALLVRGLSGIAAAGLTTLGVLLFFQSLPAPQRVIGVLIGASIPQLATPLARVIAPALLEWGNWRMAYMFELGLAMLTLAAIIVLPLPPSERSKVFSRSDLVTVALMVPGVGLLCTVLALGRLEWWTDSTWIAWASIASIVLLTATLLFEHHRPNQLIATRFLARKDILRIATVAFCMRLIIGEQTFGSTGLLSALGYGTEQLQPLYIIVTLASIAGLVAAVILFKPQTPARPIQIACLLVAIAAFIDAGSTSQTGPSQMFVSQALVGFAALLFVGPAFGIGLTRALVAGSQNFITWLVVFNASQNLGYLVGQAMWGTLQTIREKYHSNILVQQVLLDNPTDAGRLAGSAQQLNGVIGDPTLRTAEGAALVSARVTREANVLAYNDVFIVIGIAALLLFVWGIAIELKMRRRGEISPIVQFGQAIAAQIAAAQKQGQSS